MAILDKFFSSSNDPDDIRMTLGEHLEELRTRLIRAIAGLLVGALVAYVFVEYLVAFLTWPIFAVLRAHGHEPALTVLNPAERFITDLKTAFIVGLILSAPYSLNQIWGFVAAGLYPHERRWVRGFAPVSIGLFFVGASFLLVIVSPLLMNFLLTYGSEVPDIAKVMPRWLVPAARIQPIATTQPEAKWPTSQPFAAFEQDPEAPPQGVPWINLTEHEVRIAYDGQTYRISNLRSIERKNRVIPELRIGEVIPFVLHLAAAFGIGFQVPVVVAFISAIGVATADEMAKFRRYVWFGMAVGSAFITPPDIISMLFLLVPMAALFEAGLIAGRLIEKRRASA